jgi:hypothetical protein
MVVYGDNSHEVQHRSFFRMKDKTKDWIKIIVSLILFNGIIIAVLIYSNMFNSYTISLKVLLDVAIAFITDKSISSLKVSWKEGFAINRGSSRPPANGNAQ